MKPRTEIQKMALKWSRTLPELTDEQKAHAASLFDGITARRRPRSSDRKAYQVLTVCHGLQVVRTFHVQLYKDSEGERHVGCYEVVQSWLDEKGREAIIARRRMMSGYYADLFSGNSEMEVRDGSYMYTDPYHITPWKTWKVRKVLPILKRNGYSRSCYGLEPVECMKRLISDPRRETLAKTGRTDLWSISDVEMAHFWNEIKMVIRHDYRPKDVQMWLDTLELASELELDTMAQQICTPDNLRGVHDRLMKKVDEKHRKEQQQKYIELDELYGKFYGPLLDMEIKGEGGLIIRPLRNHAEFVEEGERMHNCVETYYDKKQCLILSAMLDGKHYATIELSMRNFAVKQLRGVCNKKHERHDYLCQLIKENRSRFMKAKRKGVAA